MHGDITKAGNLRQAGTVSLSTYSYFFPTTMAGYATGQDSTYYTRSGTAPNFVLTKYFFASSDFMSVQSQTGAYFVNAFNGVSSVANTTFTAGSSTSANIVISGINKNLFLADGRQAGGFTSYNTSSSGGNLSSDVFFPAGAFSAGAPLDNYVTHELGHAVGLMDADSISTLTSNEKSGKFTVMSYNVHAGVNRRATEYQLYDITALQLAYGRKDSTNSGNTTYSTFTETFSGATRTRAFSIWDGGGTDNINASAVASAAYIDLRPGHFSSIGPSTNFTLAFSGTTPSVGNAGADNVSVAFGAYIEDATGTAYNDLIIGNLLSNTLKGGNGRDVIYAEGVSALIDPRDGDYRRVTTTGGSLESAPIAINNFVVNPS